MLWSLDSILADLTNHQGAAKGSKKVAQLAPAKSQVTLDCSIYQIPIKVSGGVKTFCACFLCLGCGKLYKVDKLITTINSLSH